MKGYLKKETVYIIAGSIITFALLLFFDKDHFIGYLLTENKSAFQLFLIVFAVLLCITGILFQRTLDFVDCETRATVKVAIINIVIWCVFWVCWSVYNVKVLFHHQVNGKVFVFSFVLTTLPGIMFFIFGLVTRKEDLASRTMKHVGATSAEIAVYEKLLQPGYYLGFYGILTVPLYWIAFLICSMIK
jgi:hypothetical protein